MVASVFILAGEPSGDQLAASIMDAANGWFGTHAWFGVGGPLMQERGLTSEAEMSELSVIGFRAAFTAYPKLSALANHLVQRIIEERPRAVITVDAKGFSLRLLTRLKKRMLAEKWSVPIIHVVAPTVWAWGAWRAKSFAHVVDGLLCLFPFEVDYFTPHGVDARFIGHPEAFNNALMPRKKDYCEIKRLVLLPGSRRSEVRRLLPLMRDAQKLLTVNRRAGASLITTLVTVPHLLDEVYSILNDGNMSDNQIKAEINVACGRGAFYQHLHQADAMMAASGTVTLQTALAGVPGVTCYRTSAMSAAIGRWLVRMDRVILPNALLGREVYPFLFQEEATPLALAKHIEAIFAIDGEKISRDAKINSALSNADELRALLRGDGSENFGTRVARALAPYFGPYNRNS